MKSGGPRRRPPFALIVAILAVITIVAVFAGSLFGRHAGRSSPPSGNAADFGNGPRPTAPGSSGAAYPANTGPINTAFPGLTTFRGNASRAWYGEGPVPQHPKVIWRYPSSGGLCSTSSDTGLTFNGPTSYWCGTGWTGQPNVLQYPNGTVEVRVGAYDGNYHFIDGVTGQQMRPDLKTGDLAKGSATSDADGYPLYYAGSRDNLFRIVAMDRKRPHVLWELDAMTSVPRPLWNNDWDGAALQIGDYLLEGGENAWFYVIKLNRGFNAQGLVTVDPQIVMKVPGWDKELLKTIGDKDISIEDSVAFRDGIAYFSNSGGLLQGWNISDILSGGTEYKQVFRFWTGGAGDATTAVDAEGNLYITRHVEGNMARPKSIPRDKQYGDVQKLDPGNPSDPVAWTVQLGSLARGQGILGSPALANGVVYAVALDGAMTGIDEQTGKQLWTMTMPGPVWGSPVVVDDVLIQGDCSGVLHAWDVSNPKATPEPLWALKIDSGCIESTPAVWRGWIYVGTRGGGIYGIADARTAAKAKADLQSQEPWTPTTPLVPDLAP